MFKMLICGFIGWCVGLIVALIVALIFAAMLPPIPVWASVLLGFVPSQTGFLVGVIIYILRSD